jgi:hypothetical protein
MSAVQRAARPPIVWSERIAPPPRRNDEEKLQRDVLAFLHLALPTDAIVFAIPNGGLRSKKVAQRLSGQGVKAGIPDLQVIWRGRAYFIELKTASGRQSVQQRHMANTLHYCGAHVMLCRSLGDVERSLREATIPLRASVS